MRIREHPILEFKRGKKAKFYFNGKELYGYENESIAAALVANGIYKFSTSLKYDRPRGFFCGIGKCASCRMRVNGIPNVRTCLEKVREGMNVEMQDKVADLPDADFIEKKIEHLDCDILVVGGGPAGLCAALESAKYGVKVILVDENYRLGGQLIKQTHKFFGSKDEMAGKRGIDIAKGLEDLIRKNKNIKVLLRSTVFGYYESKKNHLFGIAERLDDLSEKIYKVECKNAIIATGASENMLVFPNNDLPGVYGAGGVQTLVNVYGVKPGEKVLMVGSGNVGLIVSYQLLQAGVEVKAVVEALPKIGGYFVHAAKLRRFGVPIYVSHTLKEVHGKDKVEGATIVKLDKNWNEIPGTEKRVDCDVVCLAVGLSPSTRLVSQTGADISYIPEAGGFVALHNDYMETSKEGIFVAGDLSGIEEASIAMIEGKIAGLAAVERLGVKIDKSKMNNYQERLKELRAGPFGERGRKAKERIKEMWRSKYGGL